MEMDRRAFIESLGGASAVAAMSAEAKADALEDRQQAQLNASAKKFPTKADIEAQIETRPYRRGAGTLLVAKQGGNVKRLPPMPAAPSLQDFFRLRFVNTSNHVLQSATRALKLGMSEDVIMACLLHDVVQEIVKAEHAWWGAQLVAPYVSERTAFAIRYHQALRFYDDKENGYKYPDLYRRMYGEDYKPEPYIEAAYKTARNHKWYLDARLVAVNDLHAFDPNAHPTIEPFTDIIGRNFKQPKDGLGYDNSPSAHMWRTIAMPDHPL